MSKLESFLKEELESLRSKGLYRKLPVIEGPQGPVVKLNGREVINLSANNYLGLVSHPKLKEAARKALETYGVGSGAVRTINGTMDIHMELERRLAAFKKTEAAVVFQSGFTANTGVIPSLMGKGDVIVSDELNHASIIDGCRLCKADRKIFAHKDVADLERVLRECSGYDKILVVTDGVFSMDGDIAPLDEIARTAKKFGAIVMVDDAHASGVLGRNGRGTVDHYDIHGLVDIQVGTLSKAVGVLGGYIAGSRNLIDYLYHRGRPFLFSTSHPPVVTAACIAAIDILENEPEIVERLWANARYLKDGLNNLGFDTGHSETPITPVMAGEGRKAMQLSDQLFEKGVFAQGIGYPTVPEGKARVRTIVSAAHTKNQLDRALLAFKEVGSELGLI